MEEHGSLVVEYYDGGRSVEGVDAYPPLILLKRLLLQKWFHIPFDPELENQTFMPILGTTKDEN